VSINGKSITKSKINELLISLQSSIKITKAH
jgi:hypothetical protein